MIDLNNKEAKEFEVNTPEEYMKALDLINSQTSFQWDTDKGKKILKLIEQVNKYDKMNFDKVNKIF